MAQVVVRNLDEDIKDGLKRRAAAHGWSMEEEARQILRQAVVGEARTVTRLGSRIAQRFAKLGLKEALPELRGQAARPADFE